MLNSGVGEHATQHEATTTNTILVAPIGAVLQSASHILHASSTKHKTSQPAHSIPLTLYLLNDTQKDYDSPPSHQCAEVLSYACSMADTNQAPCWRERPHTCAEQNPRANKNCCRWAHADRCTTLSQTEGSPLLQVSDRHLNKHQTIDPTWDRSTQQPPRMK